MRQRVTVRPAVAVVGIVVGFLVLGLATSRPAGLEARLPKNYRLADLIALEQSNVDALRDEVDELRLAVDTQLEAEERRYGGVADGQLVEVGAAAGLTAMRGPGLRVQLNDSSLEEAPSGNVNDLVIHSQDVQAVVNALWRAGAEAMAINDQRLVSTSAVLCVGNTLLLNGTVHSPPYVITSIGASRDLFDADPLVKRLRTAADSLKLGFAVDHLDAADVPAYNGSATFRYARPRT